MKKNHRSLPIFNFKTSCHANQQTTIIHLKMLLQTDHAHYLIAETNMYDIIIAHLNFVYLISYTLCHEDLIRLQIA